jgi:hypothetical protein
MDKKSLRILSLGAGVQSSTLALMSKHGDIEPFDAAIFADTGIEPKKVHQWLDWLEPQLPFPVYRVSKGSLHDASLKIHVSQKTGNKYLKSLIPAFVLKPDGKVGMFGRRCTADYKVKMIERTVRKILNIKRFSKKNGVLVHQIIGISLDEAHREKPSEITAIKHIYPLLDLNMTRTDCLVWMAAHGYPEPPKSACTICPYHEDVMWQELKFNSPEEFNKVVEFDDVTEGIPFLHQSCRPIDQVNFIKKPKHKLHQTRLFGNECTGMCGN